MNEFPHELVWTMRIIAFLSSDLEKYSIRKIGSLLKGLDTIDRSQPMNSVPFGIDRERTAIKLASSAIRKALKSYETTIEEDMKLLEDQFYKKITLTYPEYAAIVVRSGEKWILNHALDQLDEYSFFLSQADDQEIIL